MFERLLEGVSMNEFTGSTSQGNRDLYEEVVLLAEQNGELRAQLKYMQTALYEADNERRTEKNRRIFQHTWILLITVLLILIPVAFGMWTAYMAVVHGESTPSACYVRRRHSNVLSPNSYRLMGVRNWNTDLLLGIYENPKNAVDAARELGCPLREE